MNKPISVTCFFLVALTFQILSQEHFPSETSTVAALKGEEDAAAAAARRKPAAAAAIDARAVVVVGVGGDVGGAHARADDAGRLPG